MANSGLFRLKWHFGLFPIEIAHYIMRNTNRKVTIPVEMSG